MKSDLQIMVLPHYYLIALINPMGRLGQFHFATLACVLAFAHIYIYAQLTYERPLEPWNFYTTCLFGMLWMKFCILSRRLHDTGSNGLIVVPVLLAAAICYLLVIDPDFAGPEAFRGPIGQFIIDQGMRIPRLLFIAIFMYCIRAQGEAGENAYGPVFGDMRAEDVPARNANAKLDNLQYANDPQNNFQRFSSEQEKGWGQRRRPGGFGRR